MATYTYFDGDTFERGGYAFRVNHPYDDSGDTPWEREDGHGPVSEWRHHAFGQGTKPPKAAGELILCWDRGSYRTYDYAAACRMAKRDGWGFLPGRLETNQDADGQWHAYVRGGNGKLLNFEAKDPDINQAIRAVYAAHRATMTAKQYAAGAAMSDYERLYGWCNDQWQYVGVVVTALDADGKPIDGFEESLWGIESDAYDYLAETAHELADELVTQLQERDALAMG